MFTAKERKVLRFLMTSFSYKSINDIARECKLAPNGAYKILKKLEKFDIAYFEEIGRIKAYKINYSTKLTFSYLEIALTDERINETKIKIRIKDLDEIKKISQVAIIFGSYITDEKNPKDIDLLFVFEKDKFRIYKKKLDEIRNIIPYKLHDIVQTPEDLISNLKNQDKLILNIIRNGIILWGQENIVRSIKNAQIR